MMQLILKTGTYTIRSVLIPDLPEEVDRVSLDSRFFLDRNPAFLRYLAGQVLQVFACQRSLPE